MNNWFRVFMCATVGCCLIAMAFPYAGVSQSGSPPLKYTVQSFILLNLIPYLEWTETNPIKDRVFVLTILGPDPFGSVLEEEAKKEKYQNDKRTIQIKRIKKISDLEPTHILYVHPSLAEKWETIQEKIQDWNVFTVSEFDGFAKQGGMVNFILVDGTVNMEINLQAAERAGIKISSQVLQLKTVKVIRD